MQAGGPYSVVRSLNNLQTSGGTVQRLAASPARPSASPSRAGLLGGAGGIGKRAACDWDEYLLKYAGIYAGTSVGLTNQSPCRRPLYSSAFVHAHRPSTVPGCVAGPVWAVVCGPPLRRHGAVARGANVSICARELCGSRQACAGALGRGLRAQKCGALACGAAATSLANSHFLWCHESGSHGARAAQSELPALPPPSRRWRSRRPPLRGVST